MSYARYGEDGSDIYLYEDIAGGYTCALCSLLPKEAGNWSSFHCDTLEEVKEHLEQHVANGDIVPERAVKRVLRELEEKH